MAPKRTSGRSHVTADSPAQIAPVETLQSANAQCPVALLLEGECPLARGLRQCRHGLGRLEQSPDDR